MSDFNSDNAKLDEALKEHDDALAGKADAADVAALDTDLTTEAAARTAGDLYVRLLDTTTEAAAQTITADLSQLDLSLYQYLDVVADVPGVSEIQMTINGGSSYTLTTGLTVEYFGTTQGDQLRARIIAQPGEERLFCISRDISTSRSQEITTHCGGTMSEIRTLQVRGNPMNGTYPQIPAGARVTVYGMKR